MKIKPVKAWAVVASDNPGLYAYWTFDKKADQTHSIFGNGCTFNPKYDRWIRVEIRPFPKRRKKVKR